jgi:phage terminase large subunit
MTTAQIRMPDKLVPVFLGDADVRGAYGGRGSAKTRTFAKMTAIKAHMWATAGRSGLIFCGRQFMNSLSDSSLEEIKMAIREEEWLEPHFDIGEKYIRTRCGRVGYGFYGLDRNINSIKSKSRILLGWIDEAEPVSEDAWMKLIPTLREEDSELWVTWNPENPTSATNKRFRNSADQRTKIVEMNWRDNPWFPEILNRARLRDMDQRPDQYEHIWEGDFITVSAGAYFAKQLTAARDEGRIGKVAADPLMQYRAYWDIGTRDATAIWIAQFIGSQIRVVDYYEAVGQPLGAHIAWMRERGYGRALCVLPHDGSNTNHVTAIRFEDHIRQAGLEARVVKNQGKAAAMKRIEAARRLFPSIHINESTCHGGIRAIGWYHEKIDEQRGIGLGPEHDWSSHAADAFGLMCIAYEQPYEDGGYEDDWRDEERTVAGY